METYTIIVNGTMYLEADSASDAEQQANEQFGEIFSDWTIDSVVR